MSHLATSVVSSLVDLGWQVAVVSGLLRKDGNRATADNDHVIELGNTFPISMYLSAFDIAISAAGYNSFHELIFGAVPTLFVPRPRGTDDQVGRARWAAETGISLAVQDPEPSAVIQRLEELCDHDVRDRLRAACRRVPKAGGAGAAAEALLTVNTGRVARRVGLGRRLQSIELLGRANLLAALGGRRVAHLRNILGRPPHDAPDRALEVELVDDMPSDRAVSDKTRGGALPLLFTDRLEADWMSGDFPVEHILQDGSEHYREERRRIVRRYYDVR
jgi:hypothetical protein